MRLLQLAFFHFFLAFDAVARPRDRVEALGVDLRPAGNALAEDAFAQAAERALHHLEELAVVVGLVEEELFVIGAGGAVGDVLRAIEVGGPAVLLRARDGAAQRLLPLLQLLAEVLQPLLFHARYLYRTHGTAPANFE